MIKVHCHASEVGAAQQISSLQSLLSGDSFIFSTESFEGANKILKTNGEITEANIVICGFDDISKNRTGTLLNEAKKQNIKSIGILDTWKGIDRFFYENGSVRGLTDAIIVFDKFSKEYLVKKGIPEHIFQIHSNFFLDDILKEYQNQNFTIKKRASILKKLNIDNDKSNLILFSEPILDETLTKASLLDCEIKQENMIVMDYVNDNFGDKYNILIRKHPIEIIPGYKFIDASSLSLLEALNVADLVLGLSSTPIFYASQLGIELYNLEDLLKNWSPEKSQIPYDLWQEIKPFYKGLKLENVKTVNSHQDLEGFIKLLTGMAKENT